VIEINDSIDFMPPLPPPTSPGTGIKKKTKKSTSNIPHHKAGRVKVGIRCRPPFQEEIDRVKGGPFTPVILARPDTDPSALGKIILNLPTGKQREFMFDYVFGPPTAQDVVYDRVARPVVNDVLNGFNGTIFASVFFSSLSSEEVTSRLVGMVKQALGKPTRWESSRQLLMRVQVESFLVSSRLCLFVCLSLYSSLTLSISRPHSLKGLIPRAISHIFHHVKRNKATMEIKVTMSFLQIYRENIQDLLAHSIVSGGSGGISAEDNLPIREDPQRGFYVEGLQEYLVHSYQEAEALLNIGS
jgi:hypothetical protein